MQQLRVLISLIALIAISACGAAATTPKPANTSLNTPANIADIEALLSTRANALMTPRWMKPDRASFDQTIAPGEPAFRAKEDAFFNNVREFPLLNVLYHPYQDATGAATDATSSYEGGIPHLHLTVSEYLEFDTSPYFPMSVPVKMTFIERDGTWYLANEAEPTKLTKYTYLRPWFGEPISVAFAAGVIAVVDRPSSVSAATLARHTADAITADKQVLGLGGQAPPVLIDATTNGTVHNWEHNAVGALFLSNDAAPWLHENTYLIKANPRHVDQLLKDTQTLRHEVTHLLLEPLDRNSATWAREGIAEYVGSYPVEITYAEYGAGSAAVAAEPKALPTSSAWGANPTYDYSVAHAAVLALVQRSGMQTFLRFLAAYNGRTSAQSDGQTRMLLKHFYGITPAELVANAFAEFAAMPLP